jgi:integrase
MTYQNSTEIAVPDAVGGSADEQVSALTRAALDAGMPANTRIAYERAWNDFTAWCRREGRTPLPATSATLADYITYLCYVRVPVAPRGVPVPGRIGLSPRSVSQAQWAIMKAHEMVEADPPHTKKAVQVIKGYKAYLAESKDPRARPQKADAADRDSLLRLQAAVADDGLIGLRDQVMFLLGMFLAARISELVALNIEDVRVLPQGLRVSVYRKKTRSFHYAAIPRKHAPVAVDLTRKWIAALAAHGRTSGPLFVRIDRHGNVGSGAGHPGSADRRGNAYDGRIEPRRAELRIQRAVTQAGLDGKWSGHSFRRGYATEAARAKVDRSTIAAGGGWQPGSRTLEGYIQEAADFDDEGPLKDMGI